MPEGYRSQGRGLQEAGMGVTGAKCSGHMRHGLGQKWETEAGVTGARGWGYRSRGAGVTGVKDGGYKS